MQSVLPPFSDRIEIRAVLFDEREVSAVAKLDDDGVWRQRGKTSSLRGRSDVVVASDECEDRHRHRWQPVGDREGSECLHRTLEALRRIADIREDVVPGLS